MANVGKRLRPIFDLARRHGVFVNIDMQSYKHRDLTKWLFMSLLDEPAYRDWTDIGIVVQAYLQDGEQDYLDFLDWVKRRGAGIAVRLVKGAYWDTETAIAVRNNTRIPVWTRKWESDACYERITGLMLENAALIRPAFASHNVRSLAHVMAAAEYAGLEPKHYELQMLAGMGNPLKEAIVQMGRCLRIYCPYGDLLQGMGYLIRRLLENTSNDSFLKQGFGDRASYDRLLANPGDARPPSAPLPQRHYQDTFEEESMSGFENAVNTGFGSAANSDKLSAAIAAARKHAGAKHPLLIGGEHVTTTEWIESTNPAHPHEIIGYVAKAGAAHADQAVAAATRALERWSHRSPFERADIVRKLGTLLEEHRFELAAALVIGIGKNFPQADAEITEAVDYCNYHAALVEQFARRPRRRNVPGEDNVLVYDPCGVCALICSFDFPLALLAGMTTAAVVAGNTTVVKPSSSAPVIAARFVALCQEAGMPAGVISFVPGPGEIVGTHLAEHPGVHLVAFCGSRGNGLDVLANATRVRPNQRHMKRTIIDAGAKNAIIVDHDVDVDEAVSGVLESSFAFTGQKCTACSRVIALADVYDKFCAKIAEAAKTMVIGDPATPGTQIGPVIHANAKARVNAYIDEARKSARMLYEAGADELPDEGHYVAPVVLADVDPRSRIATQEVFGPVLAVIRAADIDEALRIANDSDYALTGGLYSRSPSHIERARWEFRVGNLYINRKITGSQVDVQPYGGAKLSGDGARLGGPDYIRQYTRPRTISENTIRHGLTASNDEPASQEAIAR
jgi:RHH-type proline utilization regulon transcriptional repressor/proline dehydrogenase/delta 1-pyrroline-5-carboxylate dehydrogenase